MHQPHLCLCPLCIARISIRDEEADVRALIADTCGTQPKHSQQIAHGIRRRPKHAA